MRLALALSQYQHTPKRRAAGTQLRMQGRTNTRLVKVHCGYSLPKRGPGSFRCAPNHILRKWHLSFESLDPSFQNSEMGLLLGPTFSVAMGPLGGLGGSTSKQGFSEMGPFFLVWVPFLGSKKHHVLSHMVALFIKRSQKFKAHHAKGPKLAGHPVCRPSAGSGCVLVDCRC